MVGLILPGTVMMAGLGALIGSGELNFWHAWLAGIIGCLLGDWISFWLGWRFKKPLHRWSFMKKNKALLDKTEHALHQHSMFTILVGRFVGPTRPLVPMVAGMLDLPVAKIYRAEYYWLRAVAAVLFLAGDSGGRCDRHSGRYAEWLFQMAVVGNGAAAVAGGLAVLAVMA
ncbi:Inner membrane protein yabI [Citrobacter koseri]|uniref:Inner membrane protein yabI n=1 Tax=Citrobacter koseri TaxID=545 RepID=A0A2X2VRL2_CITKO|nr:Inner membrane protein yabI [Citrobacter koseri]